MFHHISDPNSFPTALTLRKKIWGSGRQSQRRTCWNPVQIWGEVIQILLKNTSEYKQKPPDAPVEVEGEKTWLSKNGHQNVAPESLQAAEMAGWKKMRSLKLWGWLSANVIFTRGERWTWNLFEITKWYQIMFFLSRSQSSTRHGRSN